MSPTDDYHELKHKFTDDVQDRYESIRPLLLFEDISIREMAKQTGSSKNTIKHDFEGYGFCLCWHEGIQNVEYTPSFLNKTLNFHQ